MRTHGTLVKWNDDRGFGFVAQPQSHEEVFVHISAFPKDGVRPRVGEIVSFEIRTGADGRKRAEAVERPRSRKVSQSRSRIPPTSKRSVVGSLLAGAALLTVSFLAYESYLSRRSSLALPSALPLVESTSQDFKCDGRTYCSQMTSCAEARYFLKHCPDVQMDGDGDGRPCERQCN